jgi:precorrin-3B methylase
MSGRLAVVGLGPGDPRYLTPEAADALAGAQALYGYGPSALHYRSVWKERGLVQSSARPRRARASP